MRAFDQPMQHRTQLIDAGHTQTIAQRRACDTAGNSEHLAHRARHFGA
jgi:hypothetical protein